MKIQFAHEIRPVLPHGLHADAEQIGDLFVLMTFGDELENLPFPKGLSVPL